MMSTFERSTSSEGITGSGKEWKIRSSCGRRSTRTRTGRICWPKCCHPTSWSHAESGSDWRDIPCRSDGGDCWDFGPSGWDVQTRRGRPNENRMNEVGKLGENRMRSTQQEPDDEGPVRTEGDTCTRQEPDGAVPVRSAHRMKGHICKYVPEATFVDSSKVILV